MVVVVTVVVVVVVVVLAVVVVTGLDFSLITISEFHIEKAVSDSGR